MSFSITQIKYPLQYFNKPVNASLRLGALFASLVFASLTLSCIAFLAMGQVEEFPISFYYYIAAVTMAMACGYISRLFFNFAFSGDNFNTQYYQILDDYKIKFFLEKRPEML